MGGDGAAASAPLKAARAEAPRRGSCAGGAVRRGAGVGAKAGGVWVGVRWSRWVTEGLEVRTADVEALR